MADPIDLDALAELERKATEGPWLSAPRTADFARIWSERGASDGVNPAQSEMNAMFMWPVHPNEPQAEAAAVERTFSNAELVAALRNHARTLIAEAKAAKELEAYVEHRAWCQVPSEPCSCGLSALLRREDERG